MKKKGIFRNKKNNQFSKRLLFLDGLRGLAILLVFFNHISSNLILKALPVWIQPVWLTFTSSGGVAVAVFFILSGFLMAYLYSSINEKSFFWQKRYSRLFPLFTAMVVTRTLFRNFPDQSIIFYLLAIFMPAFAIHSIWIYGLKKINQVHWSKYLFRIFLILQVVMIIFYGFVIMRAPAIVFNQQWPAWWREIIISLTNLTLALPMGDYIPMLDGVYWTLCVEVLFYFLYPILFLPIIKILKSYSLWIKTLFLLGLLPFLYGVVLLSKRLFGLSIFSFGFFYYFVVGVVLGLWQLKKQFRLPKFTGSIYLFILLFGLNWLFNHYALHIDLLRLFSAWPLGIVLILIAQKEDWLNQLFSTKLFRFFGNISYSIFLVHTSVVDLAKKIYTPETSWDNLLFILLTLTGVILTAIVLNNLLEKPYFKSGTIVVKQNNNLKALPRKVNVYRPILILVFIYLVAILVAYQSDFNFFSKQVQISPSSLKNIKLTEGQKTLSLQKHRQLQLVFTATENNLGIITMSLKYIGPSYNKGQQLIVRIKPLDASVWYAETVFQAAEVGDSDNHAFGFPVLTESKNKQYVLEIELMNKHSKAGYFLLDLSHGPVRAVYAFNKTELLKQPQVLVSLFLNKLESVYYHQEARLVFLLGMPYLLFFLGCFRARKPESNNAPKNKITPKVNSLS